MLTRRTFLSSLAAGAACLLPSRKRRPRPDLASLSAGPELNLRTPEYLRGIEVHDVYVFGASATVDGIQKTQVWAVRSDGTVVRIGEPIVNRLPEPMLYCSRVGDPHDWDVGA